MPFRKAVFRTIKPGKGAEPFILFVRKLRGISDLSDTPRWKLVISLISVFTIFAMAAMVIHSIKT